VITYEASARAACDVHSVRRIVALCRIVWTSEMMPTNGVCREPLLRTRHSHRCRIRRPIAITKPVVLVSFGLKSPRALIVTAPTMIFGEPLIAIEEIDVSFRRKVRIAAHTGDPYQELRRYEVETKR
jgi:hypothetical protein